MNDARRSLLKLTPDYTAEFVWIMAKYNACGVELCQRLISSPAMKAHIARHRERIAQILANWPEEAEVGVG